MDFTKSLLSYISACTSPYHTVKTSKEMLLSAGFQELFLQDVWHLQTGDYFTEVYGSTLIAFHIGEEWQSKLHIATGHTDFPAIRIKPNPMILENGYGKLNIETYGGLILNTWLDRPLGAAGVVVCRGTDPFTPERIYFDSERAIAIIPNLAIHMNRQMNDGVALNKQVDMLPLVSLMGENLKDNGAWVQYLSTTLGCKKEDILSFELTLYPVEQGQSLGLYNEFLGSPRLDNLTSCKACLEGIITACQEKVRGLQVIALFDNEEVGSRTKQGGASTILQQVIERIYLSQHGTKEELYAAISSGFMLSADVAHALHPNHQEKNDITNKPILGRGVVLKTAASQSYAGDAEAVAIMKALCEQENIPYQVYVNRSDIPGGSTLGSIASSILPIRTMDIGVPILAMHSAYETMGQVDQSAIESLMKAFLR